MKHGLIVNDLGRWGFGRQFQSRCVCQLWTSTIEDNRPDVIRQYTFHSLQSTRQGYGA